MTTDSSSSLGEQKPQSADVHSGPGFRIKTEITRADRRTVEALGAYETPAISDLMNRLYAMDPGIHNLTGDNLRLVGSACTVKLYPGDNLMVHKALDVAEPGDVVVVDTSRSMASAALGDLVSTKARHRRIAGFLVDGLIRDLPGIKALGDFPVFARGTTPVGPLHRGPGEINYPVSAGGIVVNPGDIIVGDPTGVVVVPRGIADELLARLAGAAQREASYVDAVARGDFSNAWVDRLLEASGLTAS
ncbi:MAG: RraA family protein [Actinomycetota bacterium]|nr:RraA family protein [Actinomycetota bacterium]